MNITIITIITRILIGFLIFDFLLYGFRSFVYFYLTKIMKTDKKEIDKTKFFYGLFIIDIIHAFFAMLLIFVGVLGLITIFYELGTFIV